MSNQSVFDSMAKVNFQNGLSYFFKNYCPSEKIDKSALELLSNILSDVNDTLITEMQTKYSYIDKVNERAFNLCARSAINEKFPDNLKKNALSEAYKQLALMKSGCMVYEDKTADVKSKSVTRKSRDNTKQQKLDFPVKLFQKDIMKLAPKIIEDLKIDSMALGLLASSIHTFGKLVAERTTKTSGQKKELHPIELKRILAEYLEDSVLKLAISEGNRCMALYENGLLEFQPKKTFESDSEEFVVTEQKVSTALKLGIKNLLLEIDSSCDSEVNAQKYLGQILMDVARYLANKSSKICRRGNIYELKEVELHQSVKEEFPKDLKEHALMKSSQDVEKFQRAMASQETPSSIDENLKPERKTRTRTSKQSRGTKSTKSRGKRKSSKSPTRLKSPKKHRSSTSHKSSQSFKESRKRKQSKSPKHLKSPKKHRSSSSQKSSQSFKESRKRKQSKSPKRSKSPKKHRSSKSHKSSESVQESKKRKRSKSPKGSKTSKKRKRISSPAVTRESKVTSEKTTKSQKIRMAVATDVLDEFSRVDVSLEKETARDLSQILETVCNALIDISVSKSASSKELGTEEARIALLELFPIELAVHALAVASNAVMKYVDCNA